MLAAPHHEGMYLGFDHRYGEPFRLFDGTRGLLRLLRADDKGRALFDGELRHRTELDQKHQVALVAVSPSTSRPMLEEPMGVARAVRLVLEPEVYEVAVTVVDDYQRRGLGLLLVERILDAVEERGGRSVRFCVLPTNAVMRRLLERAAPGASFVDEDGLLRLDLPLRHCDARRRGRGRRMGRAG
jgi:GNAT superfamily N-acetyltransferase